jgi:hypothetical protein
LYDISETFQKRFGVGKGYISYRATIEGYSTTEERSVNEFQPEANRVTGLGQICLRFDVIFQETILILAGAFCFQQTHFTALPHWKSCIRYGT